MPLRERGGVALKLSGGQRPFRLFVDGTPRSQAIGRQITWMPNSPGFYDLAVLDKDGNRVSARVEITAGFGNLAQSR
jgi:penicillin-binding protein 1C